MSSPSLDTCLGISGSFEGGNGGPRWDLLTGNFDDMGISVGCLQWNPGTGSIQKLLSLIFGKLGGVPDEFAAIGAMVNMKSGPATAYAVKNWIIPGDAKKRVTPEAKALWSSLLLTDAGKEAQEDLAQSKLDSATEEAERFLPFLTEIDLRTQAFFFDLRVQQGGLSKKMPDGSWWAPKIVEDLSKPIVWSPATNAAKLAGRTKTAAAWSAAAMADPLTQVLLYYAYERANKARAEYVWDALSRRGTIAARAGQVHGVWFDFKKILPLT